MSDRRDATFVHVPQAEYDEMRLTLASQATELHELRSAAMAHCIAGGEATREQLRVRLGMDEGGRSDATQVDWKAEHDKIRALLDAQNERLYRAAKERDELLAGRSKATPDPVGAEVDCAYCRAVAAFGGAECPRHPLIMAELSRAVRDYDGEPLPSDTLARRPDAQHDIAVWNDAIERCARVVESITCHTDGERAFRYDAAAHVRALRSRERAKP